MTAQADQEVVGPNNGLLHNDGPTDGHLSPSEYDKNDRLKRDHIEFAPLVVPRHRRLQTFAVFTWNIGVLLSVGLFFLWLSIPLTWPILVPYLVWVFCIDKAPERGGRTIQWVRKGRFWDWFVGYYPVSLIKTADLPADRKYVFGYHPHGIIGMGAIANFGTDATGFSRLFPGLTPHLCTLASNFQLPIYRDILMALGMCSVSMKSCQSILRRGPGSTLTIVVGGAAESLAAHPGTADLTLRRRLGFIKLAMRNGADLVPVFSFGENEIFEQIANDKGTTLYALQKKFQKVFGFTLPLFFGRGLFNYNMGLMPYRHPIVSVVGAPIKIHVNANPSQEEMEEVQKQYIGELQRIWDDHKEKYARGRRGELRIVA